MKMRAKANYKIFSNETIYRNARNGNRHNSPAEQRESLKNVAAGRERESERKPKRGKERKWESRKASKWNLFDIMMSSYDMSSEHLVNTSRRLSKETSRNMMIQIKNFVRSEFYCATSLTHSLARPLFLLYRNLNWMSLTNLPLICH